jgi:hypothetical protein
MTRFGLAAALALTVLAASACGGETATKPTTTTTTATTVATTAPPTTLAPATTVPATTTTTLDPAKVAENEVHAAWDTITKQIDACYRQPATCVPEDFAIEPELSAFKEGLNDRFISVGRHSEPNPTEPSYYTAGPVTFSDEGLTASFDSCKWDTNILMQDDPPAVVNDLNQTIRHHVLLRNQEARWFYFGLQIDGPFIVGRNECGPRS